MQLMATFTVISAKGKKATWRPAPDHAQRRKLWGSDSCKQLLTLADYSVIAFDLV